MLKRKINSIITEWITNGNNALLVDGARQVGKTTIIRNVLKEKNCDFVEFNLLHDKEFLNFLEKANSLSSKDFVSALSVQSSHKLIKNKTIIFIDEVQVCKEVLTKVKFLVEEGSFRYIFSGSILGITLNNLESAPVGYLDVIKMYPLDFEEFL